MHTLGRHYIRGIVLSLCENSAHTLEKEEEKRRRRKEKEEETSSGKHPPYCFRVARYINIRIWSLVNRLQLSSQPTQRKVHPMRLSQYLLGPNFALSHISHSVSDRMIKVERNARGWMMGVCLVFGLGTFQFQPI